MTSNKFSISKDAESVAKKYGPNVSQGILEMERRLENCQIDKKEVDE